MSDDFEKETYIAAPLLKDFVTTILQAVDLSRADAQTVAWALVEANLEGIDTHGVSRLAIYARRVRAGLATAHPAFRWTHPAPAVALLDADNALGPVAATAAIDEAVRLAKSQGIGMVAVAHTNHAAALSAYTERAAAAGCIALMVCNTPPGIPPWGGRVAFFGTNPLAFAAPGPTPNEPPVVVDMATSIVARGNIIMAARQDKPIPEGWAIDAEGRPTTDPKAALAGAGSPYDDWTAPTDAGLWCLAIHLGPLMSTEEYTSRLGGMLAAIRETETATGQHIRIPGERRAELRAKRTREGIPIDATTRAELVALSAEVGIEPLFSRPQTQSF